MVSDLGISDPRCSGTHARITRRSGLVAYHILQSGASCRLPKTPKSEFRSCKIKDEGSRICFLASPPQRGQPLFRSKDLPLRLLGLEMKADFMCYRKTSIRSQNTGMILIPCTAHTAMLTSTHWATSLQTHCNPEGLVLYVELKSDA